MSAGEATATGALGRLRALLLEMHGYRTSVFEFISPEDTSKNLMLAAHRRVHAASQFS